MDKLVLNGPDNALELSPGIADDGTHVVVLVVRDHAGTVHEMQTGALLDRQDADQVYGWLARWLTVHPL